MPAGNLWSQFRSLQVVLVGSVGSNGTSVVKSDARAQWTVLGDSVSAGTRALVQEGRIIGEAASLPTYTVTV